MWLYWQVQIQKYSKFDNYSFCTASAILYRTTHAMQPTTQFWSHDMNPPQPLWLIIHHFFPLHKILKLFIDIGRFPPRFAELKKSILIDLFCCISSYCVPLLRDAILLPRYLISANIIEQLHDHLGLFLPIFDMPVS